MKYWIVVDVQTKRVQGMTQIARESILIESGNSKAGLVELKKVLMRAARAIKDDQTSFHHVKRSRRDEQTIISTECKEP